MSNLDLQQLIQRFAESSCSWMSTVRPDGRVHSAPVWHIWINSCAYVVTTAQAVKVGNIDNNPNVVLTHPDPHKAIIIDGVATVVQDKTELLRPLFQAKYDWDIVEDDDYDTVIEIRPLKLLAWSEEGAGHRQRWSGEEIAAVALD
jgi:general stress protein 26